MNTTLRAMILIALMSPTFGVSALDLGKLADSVDKEQAPGSGDMKKVTEALSE